jgi:hypothetical protein
MRILLRCSVLRVELWRLNRYRPFKRITLCVPLRARQGEDSRARIHRRPAQNSLDFDPQTGNPIPTRISSLTTQ